VLLCSGKCQPKDEEDAGKDRPRSRQMHDGHDLPHPAAWDYGRGLQHVHQEGYNEHKHNHDMSHLGSRKVVVDFYPSFCSGLDQSSGSKQEKGSTHLDASTLLCLGVIFAFIRRSTLLHDCGTARRRPAQKASTEIFSCPRAVLQAGSRLSERLLPCPPRTTRALLRSID
jgi:hypothetical protein